MNWNRPLAHPVGYIKPKPGMLNTLADARAYTVKRNPGITDFAWLHAIRLMLQAAKDGEVEAVTKQLILALILDGALDLKRTTV